MFRKNYGKMFYITAHNDVIDYIYYGRKCDFEEIVDNYKIINDVMICNN